MWDNAHFFPLPTCYKLRPKKRIEKKKKKKKAKELFLFIYLFCWNEDSQPRYH